MIFNQVLGNINDIKNTENLHIEKIYINSEDTLKRILRVNSDHNHEYGIALSENVELKDGDILYKDDKNLIIIKFLFLNFLSFFLSFFKKHCILLCTGMSISPGCP